MRKKSIFTKSAALFMAAAIGITAAGCSTEGQPSSNETVFNETGTQTGTQTSITEESKSDTDQKEYADNNGMGRYVETTVFESDGFMSKVETQTLSDGQIVFLNGLSKQKLVSKDSTVWENEANEPFSDFIREHYPAETAIAKDGTIAIIAMDKKEDMPDGADTEYAYNLYIYNTDDTIKQIPIEMPDADSYLSTIAFDEQGTLYAFASRCKNIYQVDINEGTAEKLMTFEDNCQLMQYRDNILMYVSYEKIFLYDMEKKSFIEDDMLDSFIKENYGETTWTGAGYTAYAFLGADNTIYIAGEKGLHRHVIGGSAVEQVIDGGLSSLGDPTNSIMAMTMNDKNEFLTAYSNGKIIKFTYDATVPSVPNDKIVVYSLNEDDLVKQTISAYQTQYPDMYVEYQIGMDEGGITKEDALKKLNTQLLSGNGPDVILFDDMNIDTYAEKGVLMDLTELVNEVDKRDGLYRNLIDEIKTDDKIYVVPAKFYIPVIYGFPEYVDSVNDYKSMADMLEKAREQYTDTSLLVTCSAKGIMKRFAPSCAPTWKDEKGQLDQNRIREFLEQSKRIYDIEMNGTPQEYIDMYKQNVVDDNGINYEDSKYFTMVHDTTYLMEETPFAYGEFVDAYTYRDMLSIPRIKGFENTQVKLLNGQSSNVYHPASIAGINTATKNSDAAKQFVNMMISATVQEEMQFGIPVNKKALPAQFAYDESDLGDDGGQFYMGFSTRDGKHLNYTIYPVDQDGIDKLEKWIAQLDTPYLSDAVLETVVYAEGAKYLEGTQDIDAAVKAIADSMEIYLYE